MPEPKLRNVKGVCVLDFCLQGHLLLRVSAAKGVIPLREVIDGGDSHPQGKVRILRDGRHELANKPPNKPETGESKFISPGVILEGNWEDKKDWSPKNNGQERWGGAYRRGVAR